MAPGFYEQLKTQNRVEEVRMGAVKFVSFQQKPAIGTAGLGACSAVVIASTYGAILGHIPPLPSTTPDPHAGDTNARFMMVQVKNLYDNNRNFFPSATTRVICAWYMGGVALPSQVEIMKSSLQAMGLTPTIKYYPVPVNPNIAGQGTVVVTGGPVVYHDDAQI